MLIPIFGSCPTDLNERQDNFKRFILGELGYAGLEWRSLGQTDYPNEFPLREVYILAKHCSGGLILGFSQFETKSGIWKKDTPLMRKQNKIISFPTPWNQLEAGILFSLKRHLLVFRDEHIAGGIFDNGTSDLFIHQMPKSQLKKPHKNKIREIIRKWSHKVHTHYYEE